eukprot:scaffold49600_cov219-Isochrysis_galbana.AAC.2
MRRPRTANSAVGAGAVSPDRPGGGTRPAAAAGAAGQLRHRRRRSAPSRHPLPLGAVPGRADGLAGHHLPAAQPQYGRKVRREQTSVPVGAGHARVLPA